MRCSRCGNENSEGNRFCGQCGAALLSAAPAVAPAGARSSSVAAASSRPPVSERPHADPRSSEDPPHISGPSFLGLADPPPPRKRESLSHDSHPSHSGNLDYLLEDEEEFRGGGAGKVFLILVALALIAGFGYLRFKTHGFPWASSAANKPASTQTPPDTAENAPAASAPSTKEEPQPTPNQPSASQPTPTQPAPSSATPPPESSTPHDKAAENPPAAKPEKDAAPPADTDANKAAESATKSGAETNSEDTSSEKDSASAAPAEPAPKLKPVERAPKPPAASRPVDHVAEAQKFIYGKGVAQDCDRGLRILKPLANQADPKAMIELGALYSAGLCTPRDLPTAYRWFAIALRKDPSNDAVQSDLQKLWGEMTQPERQLAIKLTQ